MYSTTEMILDKSTVQALVQMLRPRQWIKNVFVLAPLIFSGLFLDLIAVVQSLGALVLFCVGASAAYIVNDVHDVDRDKTHPIKSKARPLASGAVTIPQAFVLLGLLYIILLLGLIFFTDVAAIVIVYAVINYLYSVFLKDQPVVDIFTIAFGFVLRVVAGSTALDVPVSSWMFVTTFSLALYLAAIKRRQEMSKSGENSRAVLQSYSIPLMDRYAEMAATGALLFYSLFVMTSRPDLVVTIPFVLFGIFRYWYLVDKLGEGESPTDVLWFDWQLLLTVIIWGVSCMWVIFQAGV